MIQLTFDEDGTVGARIWRDSHLYVQICFSSEIMNDCCSEAAFFGWDWLKIDESEEKSILHALKSSFALGVREKKLVKIGYKNQPVFGAVHEFTMLNDPESGKILFTANGSTFKKGLDSTSEEEFSTSGHLILSGLFFEHEGATELLASKAEQYSQRYKFISNTTPIMWGSQNYYRLPLR